MNLISCDGCGLVLDQEKLKIPEMYDESGNMRRDVTVWVNGRFVPSHKCPVCSTKIPIKVTT